MPPLPASQRGMALFAVPSGSGASRATSSERSSGSNTRAAYNDLVATATTRIASGSGNSDNRTRSSSHRRHQQQQAPTGGGSSRRRHVIELSDSEKDSDVEDHANDREISAYPRNKSNLNHGNRQPRRFACSNPRPNSPNVSRASPHHAAKSGRMVPRAGSAARLSYAWDKRFLESDEEDQSSSSEAEEDDEDEVSARRRRKRRKPLQRGNKEEGEAHSGSKASGSATGTRVHNSRENEGGNQVDDEAPSGSTLMSARPFSDSSRITSRSGRDISRVEVVIPKRKAVTRSMAASNGSDDDDDLPSELSHRSSPRRDNPKSSDKGKGKQRAVSPDVYAIAGALNSSRKDDRAEHKRKREDSVGTALIRRRLSAAGSSEIEFIAKARGKHARDGSTPAVNRDDSISVSAKPAITMGATYRKVSPLKEASLILNQLEAHKNRNGNMSNTKVIIKPYDLEDELGCAICFEIMVSPVSLTCGHTFCQACVAPWLDQNAKQCPTCRIPSVCDPARCYLAEGVIAKHLQAVYTALEQQGKKQEAREARIVRGKVEANAAAKRIADAMRRNAKLATEVAQAAVVQPQRARGRWVGWRPLARLPVGQTGGEVHAHAQPAAEIVPGPMNHHIDMARITQDARAVGLAVDEYLRAIV